FGDDLSIGMASAYANHNVLKRFCRFFTAQGMAARMNVSKSRQELADDAVQAQFEDSVRRLGEKAAAGSTTAGGASSVMGPAVVEGASVDGAPPAGDVQLVGDVELAGGKEARR
ncbi:MAG: hypothetical protein MR433_03790, partial [Coriobacteriaceae bacterium]|nr:hypothetical protein [Coriobacteriaceae bacterium]